MTRNASIPILFGAVALAVLGSSSRYFSSAARSAEPSVTEAAPPATETLAPAAAPAASERAAGRGPSATSKERPEVPRRVDAVAPSSGPLRISSPHPFVVAIDGAPHLLARGTVRHEDVIMLLPLTGGAPAWSYPYKSGASGAPAFLYVEETLGLALVAEGFSLVGLDVASGAPRWSVALSDEVEEISGRGGSLVVWTRDEAVREIAAASGVATATSAVKALSEGLRSDAEVRHGSDALYGSLMRLDGLAVERFLCAPGQRRPRPRGLPTRLPCSDRDGLLLAQRRPGTPLPFLVGFDPETRAERWRLPLSEPEAARGRLELGAAWSGDDVIVAVGRDESKVRRIGLADGVIRWETTLPSGKGPWNAVTMAGDRVLLNDGRSLWALDAESGAVGLCIGDCQR
jgi:hypothetical protein